ncbi:MAG TPA: transposase [Ignavibacteria bacterium]|nr:transposase [Ignavibacteria bacterium]
MKKDGVIYTSIMYKSGKKKKKIQKYRCENGHVFNFDDGQRYTNSFIEVVVFVYLNCLSLNTTIEIIRAWYDDDILSKGKVLDFLEQVADAVPSMDDIDNVYHPHRSGYIALDGVWFKFRGMQIVLLVCFDPESFDVIEAIWSLREDEKSYTKLIVNVIKKMKGKPIKGVYADGDKGLMLSLKKHLPTIPFQLCVVHKEMRMGQIIPVKSVNASKQMDKQVKTEIKEFQDKFRSVIYADTKANAYESMKELKQFVNSIHGSNEQRFKKAVRSLNTNFKYTLTHFDYPEMERDNNLIECFNGIIKPRLKLMKGFKKYKNVSRYLKLFLLDYRFHKLKESRFEERRGLTPLQLANVELPKYHNFLSFLRNQLNLDFTSPSH